MSAMCTKARYPVIPRPCRAVIVASLLTCAAGCVDWNYDRVRMGMSQQECARTLPEGQFRRTELGFSGLLRDSWGRTDAFVILLAPDGLVSAKLHATLLQRPAWMGGAQGVRLRGLLDPQHAALDATGPVDTLRVLLDEVAGYKGAAASRAAHQWVGAALVRLLERWPHVDLDPAGYPQLADMLEDVPAGGTGDINMDPQGRYSFGYQQGVQP